MTTQSLLELRSALGNRFVEDASALDEYRSDKSGIRSTSAPIGVVAASSVEDVQVALEIAQRHRIPVVPRGAGTGLAGGAVGQAGELVVSTAALTQIREVDADNFMAVVEAGVLNGDLDAALAKYGVEWPPDPASAAISSVGGNVATNAGGLHCVRHGVTRDWVLGVEMVLPGGDLVQFGRRSVKGVTGFDLTALATGSEGTLGIITAATLKLRAIDTRRLLTVTGYYDNDQDAASASLAITELGHEIYTHELVDSDGLELIALHAGADLPSGAMLLVQSYSTGADERDALVATLERKARRVDVADSPAEADRLLKLRRSFHPALEARHRVLIEDVCVPRTQLGAMFDAIDAIERRRGIRIPTVAHAGDGNLHPNFLIDETRGTDGEVPESIWEAADELFHAALELGGTLTGEHGVGTLKLRWLRDELGDRVVNLSNGIRQVFDPYGIMNPGKAISSD